MVKMCYLPHAPFSCKVYYNTIIAGLRRFDYCTIIKELSSSLCNCIRAHTKAQTDSSRLFSKLTNMFTQVNAPQSTLYENITLQNSKDAIQTPQIDYQAKSTIQQIDDQPKLTIQQIDPSIAVRPQNRQRAITYLQEVVQKSGSDEDPSDIESKIFEASKSILYEYINALCHKRVLLENTHKRTVESQPIGPGRKRKADTLARNHLPEPKKHKTTPYFQWFYNGSEYTSIKLSIRDNEVLETHFLNGPSSCFSHQFEFERVPKQVDVEKQTVDGEHKVVRKLFVLDSELIAPSFWTPKQSNIFHSFDLDPTSDRYKQIAANFAERLPNATINFIRQLQHIVNYQRYSFERNRILLLGDFDDREIADHESEGEKLLYFGSKKTVPRTIILDRDGFDCLSANHTAHFYQDPYIADKDAFVIVNAQTRAQNYQKKQILAALVLTGNSNEILDSELNVLKRPPLKHTVNGMDQIYDSTWRTRTENGCTSKEYLIQNKFQAYAAFLIDYNTP